MADILKMLTNKDRLDYAESFEYKTDFIGESLFPSVKTGNLKLSVERLVENGNLPVMALVHAFDTEARVGDRPDFRTFDVEKLMIKEKINQTERIAEFLNGSTDHEEIKRFVYDDMGNMITRVYTRAEYLRMQLLANGKIEIDENNYKTSIDFGYKASHSDTFTGWSDPEHDIIADLEAIQQKAKDEGYTIVRALTSNKVLKYIIHNEAIRKLFATANQVPTASRIVAWVYDNFGIQFATNDEKFKLSAKGNDTHRFYPEDKITFIAGGEQLGKTFYGVTPEELVLTNGVVSNANVVATQWNTEDPVATWTKATAICLPAVNDINRLFIVTVSA